MAENQNIYLRKDNMVIIWVLTVDGIIGIKCIIIKPKGQVLLTFNKVLISELDECEIKI